MAIALGILIGLMLGLTGAGGAVIAIPVLVFVLGLDLQQAAPIALLAACVAASIGTFLAWRQHTVRYRAALLMASAATATSWLGIRTAERLSNDMLMLAFSLVLVAVAVRMLLQSRQPQDRADADALCPINPQTGRLIWTPKTFAVFSAVGALNGALTGLLGVGGGFLIVPVLRSITPLSMHSAVSTSLMTVALTTAATFTAYVAHGKEILWLLALPFVAGAVIGMGGGRLLAPRLSGAALQIGFAITLLICAVAMAASTLN